MKACVTFDTRYGNTEKVAEALRAGLEESGIQTVCTNLKYLDIGSLGQYDLICVGGPTQYRTASSNMKEFLESMVAVKLSGKLAFAFDTRRDSLLAGSAAKYIEARLRNQGLIMINQSASAIIVSSGPERKKGEFRDKDDWKEWRHQNEKLRGGEEEKFKQFGASIGMTLVSSPETSRP